ncbi:MAG: LacI family transcriptional regulator [Ruminococcaceae bacterium]|nr:LacI family transcriptional regulator [Oscillospiraceae bacterium]
MKKNTISTGQLAKICGVSQGTVDRALHNRAGIKPETREKILRVAHQFGYRPNAYCEFDGKKHTGLVGILVFDLYNAYFSHLVMSLERELRRNGYCALVMFSDKDKQQEIECVERMYNAGVDGLILAPVNDGVVFSSFLKSWGIPAVTLGNRLEGTKYIGVDNFEAMKQLTGKALSAGWKKFAYFAPALGYQEANLYGQEERFRGFLSAMEESGATWQILPDAEAAKELSEDTIIITSTDYYAEKIIKVCGNSRTVTGFDAVFSGSSYPTVGHDWEAVARLAVSSILEPNQTEDIFVPVQLINIEQLTN